MLRIFVPAAVLLASLACTVQAEDDDQPTTCTPGQVFACMCPDGASGTATCGFDNMPGVCMCGGTTTPTSGSDSTADPSTTMTTTDPTDDPCTTDCGDTTTSADSADTDACPIYSGTVANVMVPWSYMGQMGLMGGEAACESIGADHVCDYVEVVEAEQAGELADLPPGTVWIHRTTIEPVDGVPSAPGPGGRCVDWADGTGTLADGEWAEITADGILFNLDPDTFYDGLDSSHTDPALFPCMGVARGILCCNPAC